MRRRPAPLAAAVLILLFVALPRTGAARTWTLFASPYRARITVQPYPFDAGGALHVVVRAAPGLDVQLQALPGLGVDATEIDRPAEPGPQRGSYAADLPIPVSGPWTIQALLRGPQGTGQAAFDVVALAPPAMPPALAWCIGLSPLGALLGFAVSQYRWLQTDRRQRAHPHPRAG